MSEALAGSSNVPPVFSPVPPQQRIETVDVLRGFALLGVALVNFSMLAQPHQRLLALPWPDAVWPWTTSLLILLAKGKFYGLFSFLFGMGFAIQMERFERSGRFFARRLVILLALGLLHGLLVWYGDILAAYAVLGYLLILFRKRADRTLLIWAAALIATFAFLALAGYGAMSLALSRPEGRKAILAAQTRQESTLTKGIDTSIRAYGQGPYSALFRYRAKELARNYGATLAASGHILAMFLLGAWTHRRGILKDVAAHRTFLRRLMWVSLPSGLALNVFYLWAIRDGMGPKNIDSLLGMAAYFVGAPLLTLAYVAIVALAHAGAGLGLLRLLAPVGRMALTNYLTQSLAGTTIFYFYGFGLYDRVPLPGMLALAFLIWCVQLPVSKIWLRYFSMGPAEWLWRALSYRKAPAFLAAR